MPLNDGGLNSNRVEPTEVQLNPHDEALRELTFSHALRLKQSIEYKHRGEAVAADRCERKVANLKESILHLQKEQTKKRGTHG